MNNFTPRAQQVLALARKEADRFNHNYIGTEHVLLGLIKLGQGVAVSVLQRMGLDLMVGCYSDSSLLNGAAAQLLPLIRWPDLDSHLNLVDDPYAGLFLQGDCLQPSSDCGLGIRPLIAKS